MGKRDRWVAPALLAATGAFYLFRLGRADLYDLDESVYAEIAREMVAMRDWLTPHLDFVRYLEKPPLFDWLNAAALKAFGVSTFAARLTSALAAVAGVGCVYGLGRDLWSRRTGVVAGAVLATCFGYFVFGRMAMPDMLFVALLTAAFWGLGRALIDEAPPPAAVFGAYAALAGAVLAKGIIGLVLPLLAVAAFVLVTRDWTAVRRLRPLAGGAFFLLLALPWHLLAEAKNPGFLKFYVVDEHIRRFLGRRRLVNYATLPLHTYFAITLMWFCPWTVFLPVALTRFWPRAGSRDKSARAMLFVILWAAAVIGFFVASASRLEYYALPALPALALCVARLWDEEMARPKGSAPSRGWTVAWVALVVLTACLVPAALLFPRLQGMRFYNLFPNSLPSAAAGAQVAATAKVYLEPGFARLVPLFERAVAIMVMGVVLSAWAWSRRRPKLAWTGLVCTMGLVLTAVEDGFVLFEPYRSVASLAKVVRSEYRPGEQIFLQGRYEHNAGLGFYTGRRVRIYRAHAGVLVYGSLGADPGDTFISDSDFERAWQGPGRAYLLSNDQDCLNRLEALAPSTVILGQAGPKWLLANRAETRND